MIYVLIILFYWDYNYFSYSYEYLDFYIFFINHEIPNNNTYIFNFDINEKYIVKEYSQDYFLFKISLFQNDKMLKTKIKLRKKKKMIYLLLQILFQVKKFHIILNYFQIN